MKKVISLILIFSVCVFSFACVIETPQQHYDSLPEGEPTGRFAEISVNCSSVFSHLTDLKAGIKDILPPDGVILAKKKYEIRKGDTLLKFLADALKNEKLLYAVNSGYLVSINNLGEKDCGSTSGWIFFLNGKMPSFGASSYLVKENDVIEWLYSCDIKDVQGLES